MVALVPAAGGYPGVGDRPCVMGHSHPNSLPWLPGLERLPPPLTHEHLGPSATVLSCGSLEVTQAPAKPLHYPKPAGSTLCTPFDNHAGLRGSPVWGSRFWVLNRVTMEKWRRMYLACGVSPDVRNPPHSLRGPQLFELGWMEEHGPVEGSSSHQTVQDRWRVTSAQASQGKTRLPLLSRYWSLFLQPNKPQRQPTSCVSGGGWPRGGHEGDSHVSLMTGIDSHHLFMCLLATCSSYS